MTYRGFLRRTPIALAALVLTLSLLSGCGIFKKRQANAKIEAVQQSLDAARSQGADRYLPQLFAQATQLIGGAQSGVQNGTYDEAIMNADSAVGVIDQINAQINGKRQEIEGKKAQLIDLQNRITDTVERIKFIGPEQTDLIAESENLNGFIQQVQSSQVQVSEGETGYDAALMRAQGYLGSATASLSELEISKSKLLLKEIEDAWARAQSVEVLKYIEEAGEIEQKIPAIQGMVAEGKGREVLEQFSNLPQAITGFEDQAREKRAIAQIDRAQRLIEIAEKEPDGKIQSVR